MSDATFMTPDEINEHHGKPVWRCWKCQAERGLYWWHGLSVAVCRENDECTKALGEFFAEERAREEAYLRRCQEWGYL